MEKQLFSWSEAENFFAAVRVKEVEMSCCGGNSIVLQMIQFDLWILPENLIVGKIFNGKYVLHRVVRDHAMRIDTEKFRHKIALLDQALKQCRCVCSKQELLGIEGEAAQVYFSVMDDMILQQKEYFQFSSRNRRPAKGCHECTVIVYVFHLYQYVCNLHWKQ